MWQRWNQSSHIFEKSTDNGVVWTPLPLNASIITEGTIDAARLPVIGKAGLPSTIAYKDEENSFGLAQHLIGGFDIVNAYPNVLLSATSDPVNARGFWIENWSQDFRIMAYNDDRSVLSGILGLTRFGDLRFSGTIKERNRSIAIGEYSQAAASTYSHPTGISGTYWYAVIGKMLILSVFAYSASFPASAMWRFNFPYEGYVPAVGVYYPVTIYTTATGWVTGSIRAGLGANLFDIYLENDAAFVGGVTYVSFSHPIPIQ